MHATFYLLKQSNEPGDNLPAHFDLGCQLAADFYRQGKRVFIYTQSQDDALLIDEHLWGFDPDSFVPHNLAGEGPRNGAPVEISHQQPSNFRNLLINLSTTVPRFATQFSEVVDFVPADDAQKQAARERYKHYRQLGFQLTMADSHI